MALLFATAAAAQSVRWQADPASPSTIQLVFENCAPDGDPVLPTISGATLTYVGSSQNIVIENFVRKQSVMLTYFIRSRQSAPLQIPAFAVKSDRGTMQVAAFTGSGPSTTLASVASAKLTPERTSVWAGEVFDLTYVFSASRRHNPQPQPTFEWNAAPLVAEDWPKFEFSEPVRNGDPRIEFTYRTRVFAKTPNTLKLEAANHILHIQTGTLGFGFLTQPRMEPVSVTSDQPVIEVKPLPPAPAGFSGAVGQFKLVSKVVPEKAAPGEPVTWTLELSGTGNWPDISGLPQREVSNDFRVVQPKAKRTPAEGKLFDATLVEDVVLVPTKAGTYTLGPVSFQYFDPKSGTYKKVTTPAQTLTIAAPPTPQFKLNAPDNANAPADDAGKKSAAEAAEPRRPLATPAAPAGIPRDPLPGSAIVRAPMPRRSLVGWLVAPVPCLLAFWTVLAVRRAQRTDPLRPQREARARVLRTLAALQAATERAERTALLLAWQRDTALLWQLTHAAPHASALGDSAWSTLWREADRAIYGANGVLPADWIARAHEAAAAKRVPGFQPLRLFRPQNLFPFAAAIALACFAAVPATLLIAAATSGARLDPLAAYRAGDFAGAEKSWRSTLATQPTDWIAHHNLSLALSQQEKAGEAAGHATAAFVQHPRHPSTRWHFALASEKAGFSPGGLEGFLTLGPRHSTARLASPAEWQIVLIAAAWVAALGLALLLLDAYGTRRLARRVSALVLALAGFGAGALAAPALTTYGVAADARAVMVARPGALRSIPTETDTTQKTTPLSAGATAIAIKVFPDAPQERWLQLQFDNGQTGWVRREDVVPLWR